MKRKQVPQFITQDWFPSILKNLIREFLDWFVIKVKATRPFVPLIIRGLEYSKKQKLVIIKQNVGAGFATVIPFLQNVPEVVYTNLESLNAEQDALYLSVNSFHQYTPEQARQLLSAIAGQRQPILILEGNNDSLWQIVGMTVFVPLTVLLASLFVRPFRWSRLLFTYAIPLLPVIIMIDGCLALAKLYSPADLDELWAGINVDAYGWESGKMDNNRGGKIIYLLGYPND